MANLTALASIEEAARFADLGVTTIAIRPGSKEPVPDRWREAQFEPQPKSWTQRQFAGWLDDRPDDPLGIGLVFGAGSRNLAALDFDDPLSFRDFREACPALAGRPLVHSSRGYHVYLRLKRRKWPRKRFGWGELKTLGYCVAPPTIHPSGRPYEWLTDFACWWRGYDDAAVEEFLFGGGAAYKDHLERLNPERTGEDRKATGQVPLSTYGSISFPTACVPPWVLAGVEALAAGASPQLTQFIAAAICGTVPTAFGHRDACLWRLARALKWLPGFEPRWIDPIADLWREAALATIRTKEAALTRATFRRACANAKIPLGWRRQFAAPLAGDGGQRVLAICRQMAAASPSGEFFLSARDAGRAADLFFTKAAKWLRRLVDRGDLVIVKRARPSRSARLATVYRLGGGS